MKPSGKSAVLFVCTGNICRSPTAEAIFRKIVEDKGLGDRIHIESAGIEGYHTGSQPDARSQQAGKRRGYDLSCLRARQFEPADFDRFDLILAMDYDHLHSLVRMAPDGMEHKVKMMLSFSPKITHREVPDPYYGGPEGFELVLDLLEKAADGLLATMQKQADPAR